MQCSLSLLSVLSFTLITIIIWYYFSTTLRTYADHKSAHSDWPVTELMGAILDHSTHCFLFVVFDRYGEENEMKIQI